MSAALRFPHALGSAGLRMTAREYFSLGETDERYELIDGILVMSPSPTVPHQDPVRALLRQIEPALDELPGVRLILDTDIQFAEDTIYRPDISLFLPGRLPDKTDYPDVPPDLIIEVISASSKARDLITKRDDYARFGVREYWVIDPGAVAIRVFRAPARARKYAFPTAAKSAIDAVSIPGLSIDLAMVREALRKMSASTPRARSKRPRRR